LEAWKVEHPDLKQAFEQVVSKLRRYIPRKLSPLSIAATFVRSRKGTNLGFPDVTSNWDTANLSDYLRRAKELRDGKKVTVYPFIMFKRVQPGGPDREDAKQRPVWGADHATTFAELSYLYVVLDQLRTIPGFEHLLGIDYLERALQRRLPLWKHKFSLDLGQADATFGPLWVLIGLSVLAELIEMPLGFLIQTYQNYTSGDILTPVGIYKGVHGLPSGVGFTNLLEILGFLVEAENAFNRQGITDYFLHQNGDDGLYLSNVELNTEQAAETFATHGLILNEAKSDNDTEQCSYLQRHFLQTYGNKAVMSTNRMLNRILLAERGVNVEATGLSVRDFWTLNTIAKLENCKRHPLFREFVYFVASGDRWNLDPTPVLSKSLDAIEGFSAFGDSVYGTTGLAEFDTVKVLFELQGKGRGPRVNLKSTLSEPDLPLE